MIQAIKLTIYSVKDMASAKTLYAKLLGVAPYVDSPYYVGFKIGEQEVGLAQQRGTAGPLTYWDVADIQASVKAFVEAGATVVEAPHEVGGGLSVGSIKDADGNLIGIRGH